MRYDTNIITIALLNMAAASSDPNEPIGSTWVVRSYCKTILKWTPRRVAY